MRVNVGKRLLLEFLDFLRYKVDNDLMTMEEIESASRMLQENMKAYGTIKDFAGFYNTSESHIRATIARKLLAKPKRVVLYPFHKFMEIVPKNLREKSNEHNKLKE